MKNLYKKNKILQISGFCATVEEGSVSKAAKKLNTVQSNVSLQVSSFEEALKMKLFSRKGNKLILTKEGERVYSISKKLLKNFESLFSDTFTNIKNDFDKVVNLASHPFLLSHILPKYFRLAKNENSKVVFNMYNLDYNSAIDMLCNDMIDIAFFCVDLKNLPKNIEALEFYNCCFSLAMDKNHPLANIRDKDISWDMISNYDYITVRDRVSAQGLKNIIDIKKINSSFILNNGTWEICSGLIKEGLTISGADINYVKSFPNLVLKRCPNLLPDYKFYALTHKGSKISQSSSDFLDIIKLNPSTKLFS